MTVLEEHAQVGEPVHCTGIVSDEVLALPGVPADSVLAWPSGAVFHSPGGHSFACDAMGERVCIVDRGAFDRGLAERAVAVGARIITRARVAALEIGRESAEVVAEVRGERRRIRGRICVLATGASYSLQRSLGWGAPPLALGAAQGEMTASEGERLELFFRADTSPKGFAWVAPVDRLGEKRARVGVMAPRAAAGILRDFVDDLRRAGRVLGELSSMVVRPLPLAPLSRTYGDRVLAVGDAAGLVKPTTGGGIYYSLLSAGWAADTIAAAFEEGDCSAAMLSAYERTWRKHLGRELFLGTWFRRLASRLTTADMDALARLTITNGVMPVVRRAARFNWHGDLIIQLARHPGIFQIARRLLLEAAGLAPSRG